MPQQLTLSLGKPAPFLELTFNVRSTRLAALWSDSVADCLKSGGLRDRFRFANFASSYQQEKEDRISAIQDILVKLHSLHPEIDFGNVDFSDPQTEVNRLHVNFADRHLIRHDMRPESLQLWSDFNSQLHLFESAIGGKMTTNNLGIRGANLTITFKDPKILPLAPDDFDDAVLYRSFGTVYLEYSQVGRHILELFNSGDTNVPKEHIQPFSKMSADMFIWFGHNQGHSYALEVSRQLEQWFVQQKSHSPFAELQLDWNPRALGVGFIPVATLAQPMFSTCEINELQKSIGQHQYVANILMS
jgi:hypothetical protein